MQFKVTLAGSPPGAVPASRLPVLAVLVKSVRSLTLPRAAQPSTSSGSVMQLSMTTREIAELTDKRHADVMRDTRTMLDKLGQNPEVDFDYSGANGRRVEFFELDRDLTMTLVS